MGFGIWIPLHNIVQFVGIGSLFLLLFGAQGTCNFIPMEHSSEGKLSNRIS